MRLLGLCLAATLVWATGTGSGSAAENIPPRSLSLAAAKRLAFSNNWDLLAARSDVDIAAAQRIVAREFPNPSLAFSTAKIDTDRGSGTSRGNGVWERSYDTVAAVNQLFEIGGKRGARRESATAGFKAAGWRLSDARRLLDQAVTKAYVSVLLAETNAMILRQSAGSLRKEADIANVRHKAGDISDADESQIQIAADRLELDSSSAEAATTSAKIAVDVLLGGRDLKGDWEPTDSLEAIVSGTLPAPLTAAPSRPDLLAAEAAVEKAQADLKLQQALRVPDPTVLVQYEHEPADQPNTVGVGLSFPLPLWNHNRGNIEAARAAREQAEFNAHKVRTQIASDIATAKVTYRAAVNRFEKERDQIVPKSAKIRETVSFAYQKGGASLLDLLLAERNDNDVRLSTAQAAADAANAAADLKAALNLKEEGESK